MDELFPGIVRYVRDVFQGEVKEVPVPMCETFWVGEKPKQAEFMLACNRNILKVMKNQVPFLP